MKKGKFKGSVLVIVFVICLAAGASFLYLRYQKVMSENGFAQNQMTLCIDSEKEIPVKGSLEGYQWISTDPGVLKVQPGKVIAVADGNATVVAKKYWYQFSVTVSATQHDAEAATCTEPSVCKLCQKELAPALGHDFTEATCTEDSYCRRCKTSGKKKAFGHDAEPATCTEASVCKTCKQEVEPVLGHDFSEATCTEDSFCNCCRFPGEQKALGHDMQEATCTEPAKCSRCEYTEGKELGHALPKKRDCTKDTLCERCKEVVSPAGEHQFSEATCTKPKTCKICKKTEGKALGHDYTEATCSQRATCTRCGKTTGSTTDHWYVKADSGKTVCAYCGVEKPVYTGGGSSSSGSTNADISAWANRVLELINEERAKEGLSAMTMDAGLQDVANLRAAEIVELFSHTRPDGTNCFTAYKQFGVNYRAAGENIAYGYSSPEKVMDGWMNSPGHRANILSTSFGRVGVGIVKSGGTYYWVQNFAN